MSTAEDLRIVAHIHEEDCVILTAEEANTLADAIENIMRQARSNPYGSDYSCGFCHQEERPHNSLIKHAPDCVGDKDLLL